MFSGFLEERMTEVPQHAHEVEEACSRFKTVIGVGFVAITVIIATLHEALVRCMYLLEFHFGLFLIARIFVRVPGLPHHLH